MIRPIIAALLVAWGNPAKAELSLSQTPEHVLAYVENNLLGIFYHELGHALIDQLELPIFGQEEDAADVLSVFLIDAFFEEESAVQMAYDTAFGFLGEAENAPEIAFWDVHGPDLQRYYNLVCLFYGANPEERDDVAEDLGLPEERAEYCPDEFEQAAHSWGGALDEIASEGGGTTLYLAETDDATDAGIMTSEVIAEEIRALNEDFRLPEQLNVRVQECGEANAFYDPEVGEIIMCSEFADALVEMAPEG